VKQATFRFYAELNDFLPAQRRMLPFSCRFELGGSVKNMIEAIGAPHTEIDLILVNGDPVDFNYLVRDGDRISVYPVFESFDITPLLRLRPQPLRETRFVLDVHLGRLAASLRMLGFDTLYRNDLTDAQLARISSGERRILLTRDRGVLKRSLVTHGYLVRQTSPRRQIEEVLQRFDLAGSVRPFTRCMNCNSPLAEASPEDVALRVPAEARRRYQEFRMCPACRKVFWKGGHYRRMQQFIRSLGPLAQGNFL
jgi:uncharacterized protein with PIN domain